jgi:hypothetical protein
MTQEVRIVLSKLISNVEESTLCLLIKLSNIFSNPVESQSEGMRSLRKPSRT